MNKSMYAAVALALIVLWAASYIDLSTASIPSINSTSPAQSETGRLILPVDSRLMHPSPPRRSRVLALVKTRNSKPIYIRAWIYIYPPWIEDYEDKAEEVALPGGREGGVALVPLSDIYIDSSILLGARGQGCIYTVRLQPHIGPLVIDQRLIHANCSGAVLYIRPLSPEETLPEIPLKEYVEWSRNALGPIYYAYTDIPEPDKQFLSSRMKYILGEHGENSNLSLAEAVRLILGYIGEYTHYGRTIFSLDSPARTLLLSGKGDCFEASLAFANMLRFLGVPARLATGYYVSSYTQENAWFKANITTSNLHMWVEIPSDRGWLIVDPTPPLRTHSSQQAGGQSIGAQAGGEAWGGLGAANASAQHALQQITSRERQGSVKPGNNESLRPGTPPMRDRTYTPRILGQESTGRKPGASLEAEQAAALMLAAGIALLLLEHVRREEEVFFEEDLTRRSPLEELGEARLELEAGRIGEALRKAYEALKHALMGHMPIHASETVREVLGCKMARVVGRGFPQELINLLERVFYGAKQAERVEVEKWISEAERFAERLQGS
jgi:uncharacterized protein (UPF0332 family)